MSSKTPKVDHILKDPLRTHMELRRRGSNFAQVARDVSTPDQPITEQHVRAAVYRFSLKHEALIVGRIREVLKQAPTR